MARPSALAAVDISTIKAEIQRRGRLVSGLARMRDRLRARVVALDARIADWGGAVNGTVRSAEPTRQQAGARRRRSGGQTLTEALAALLNGRTMRVIEAAAAVRKVYPTESKHFATQVAIALSKGPFRRVSRGRYTATGAAAGTANGHVPTGRVAKGHRPGSRERTRNGKPTLASVLVTALEDRTMTVTEAVAAAKAAGYKSKATAKGFYHATAIALAKSGRFRRVRRGKYRAR